MSREQLDWLELHYHLRDGAHEMDAFIRNKCEAEALAAFMHVAKQLGIEVQVETHAFAEGGLREAWKILTKPEYVASTVALLGVLLNSFVMLWVAAALRLSASLMKPANL